MILFSSSVYFIDYGPECGAFAMDKTMSQLNPSDYLYSILRLIGSYETTKLTKTFSSSMKESVNLGTQAEELTDWFQGYLKTYDEIKVSVRDTEDYTITEGYYEVSTYDLWKEYNTNQNEILNTYLIYFKHQRGLKNSDSDGMLTIQIVEKTSDDMELNPLDQYGIYFDFM